MARTPDVIERKKATAAEVSKELPPRTAAKAKLRPTQPAAPPPKKLMKAEADEG